jgi:hypothetical protein
MKTAFCALSKSPSCPWGRQAPGQATQKDNFISNMEEGVNYIIAAVVEGE